MTLCLRKGKKGWNRRNWFAYSGMHPVHGEQHQKRSELIGHISLIVLCQKIAQNKWLSSWWKMHKVMVPKKRPQARRSLWYVQSYYNILCFLFQEKNRAESYWFDSRLLNYRDESVFTKQKSKIPVTNTIVYRPKHYFSLITNTIVILQIQLWFYKLYLR